MTSSFNYTMTKITLHCYRRAYVCGQRGIVIKMTCPVGACMSEELQKCVFR